MQPCSHLLLRPNRQSDSYSNAGLSLRRRSDAALLMTNQGMCTGTAQIEQPLSQPCLTPLDMLLCKPQSAMEEKASYLYPDAPLIYTSINRLVHVPFDARLQDGGEQQRKYLGLGYFPHCLVLFYSALAAKRGQSRDSTRRSPIRDLFRE